MASVDRAADRVILIPGLHRSSSSYLIVRYSDGRCRVCPISLRSASILLWLARRRFDQASAWPHARNDGWLVFDEPAWTISDWAEVLEEPARTLN